MKKEEKILAIQLILEDIRENWADDLKDRVNTARELAKDLSSNNAIYLKMVSSIDEFKEDMYSPYIDGRFFRCSFPKGYIGMDSLHKLEHTYNDKSDEFKQTVECLTFPEYRFTDWE